MTFSMRNPSRDTSVRLRLMTAQDVEDGMRLKDAAGWNQTPADWERFLSAGPEGCFVAESNSRVIGTSTTIVYEGRLAWIGMVVVESQCRGQRIGTALLERAIQYLDSCGVPCMKLDATPQGKPLYENLGFVSEYDIERWRLRRQPSVNDARNELVELDDVLRLDCEAFGADRSGLLRSLTEAAPDFTLVMTQANSLAGYSFGRRGSLADHLGPWMARSESVAAALLDKFLRRSSRELVFVDCMRSHPWAVPLLRLRGFEFVRPLTRMYRGTNQYAGRPELLCAIAGPEFG